MAGGHTSWLVGGGVVLVGVAAAMPFYRGAVQQSQGDPGNIAAQENTVPWDGDPLTLRVGAEPPVRSTTTQLPRTTLPSDDSALTHEPPAVDGEYGGLLNQFRGAPPSQQISSDPATRALSISSTQAVEPETQDAIESPIQPSRAAHVSLRPVIDEQDRGAADEERPAEKRHSIVDGDTLERIALRYYGDAFYASALFEHNRDLLTDPELLPVGKRILIPSREAVMTGPTLPLESLINVEGDATPQTQLESLR